MQFWRRRKALSRDKEALSKILAEETPPIAGAVPVTIQFGRGRLIWLVVAMLGGTVLFVLVGLASQDRTFSILLAVTLTLIHVSAIIADPTLLDVSVAVSGEGVRSRRWFGERLVSWWEKPSVTATPDIATIVIKSGNQEIKVRLQAKTAEKRIEFVHALRAWTRQYDYDIVEAPGRLEYVQTAVSTAVGIAGVAILLGGVYLFPTGNVLGIRCSVNSAYLQERYSTPERQGCVVLRVSAGAENAGIFPGDLMIEMNGTPITSGQQFSYVFDGSSSNHYLIKVIRGGKELSFDFHGAAGKDFPEDTNDPIWYYLKARGEAATDSHAAEIDYSNALHIDQNFDLAWLYLAEILDDDGESDKAATDYEQALDLSPNLGEAHELYAWFLSESYSPATRSEVEKAVALDDCEGSFEEWNYDCASDYMLLSLTVGREGDFERMAEFANQSIRFYSGFPGAYYDAACAEAQLGKMDEAKAHANQYLEFSEADRDAVETADLKFAVLRDSAVCLGTLGAPFP